MKAWKGKVVAIVPAGGTGSRMGSRVPKQFLKLADKPILIHTLEKLQSSSLVDEIVIAVPADQISFTEKLVAKWRVFKVTHVVSGGRERQDSVRIALNVIGTGASMIMTHDAVRPLVSVEKIEETIQKAWKDRAAILAVREKNTVKNVTDGVVSKTMDRANLWQIQTPQVFRADLFREAYEHASDLTAAATDDAALVERLGQPVHVVEGDDWNIKITSPADMVLAEAILGIENREERIKTILKESVPEEPVETEKAEGESEQQSKLVKEPPKKEENDGKPWYMA
ncbi:2-C-methyl-D-erythritol 4-phosphate cytidylyltransferase [bacterium]|nr:2-C-methyl-D-erythritol 4-phosphate cytidylyltransferase [bacterium]